MDKIIKKTGWTKFSWRNPSDSPNRHSCSYYHSLGCPLASWELYIALLDLITVVGDTVAGYVIEAILKGIYTERSRKESVIVPIKKIQDLLIIQEIKSKLKNLLSIEISTDVLEV